MKKYISSQIDENIENHKSLQEKLDGLKKLGELKIDLKNPGSNFLYFYKRIGLNEEKDENLYKPSIDS